MPTESPLRVQREAEKKRKRMATYECTIRFESACHVPVADFWNGSSDPYVEAFINRKTKDELSFRTSTCRSTRDPKWQASDVWHVGGVKEGQVVDVRMFDEDPRKSHDDRIGVCQLKLEGLEQLVGSDEQEIELKVQKRKASMKVYFLTYTYSWLGAQDLRSQASRLKILLSVKKDEQARSRPCLIGPIRYDIHFSPLLGRLAGTSSGSESKVRCFLGYQMHLRDVPACRFEYTKKRSEIVMMYSSGIRGKLIRRALRAQHDSIYGFDARTIVNSAEPADAAARFLEMTDAGSEADEKIFTYAITTDGTFHFTRTGKQFAINHLSKHAMHSNTAREVVYSGEFFFVKKHESDEHNVMHNIRTSIRAQTIIKDKELVNQIRQGAERIRRSKDNSQADVRSRDKVKFRVSNVFHHAEEGQKANEPSQAELEKSEHRHTVSDFTLIIDNSSGTFMPDAKNLPDLEKFLASNFKGLQIKALAQDDPQLEELKKTRNMKAEENEETYGQPGSTSSSSSASLRSTEGGNQARLMGKAGVA